MTTFFRLITILATVGYYRLDALLPAQYNSFALRVLLLPFKFKRAPQLNRGARLRSALEDLGPIFVKFGQLLSTRPDLIPADLIEELNQLQDQVAPFGDAEFRQIVEDALGDKIENLFREFSETPLASASIAQVHTAVLPNGDEVVIKAVRPGIDKVIHQDITLMGWFAIVLERLGPDGRRLRPVEVVNEYRQTIFDELDLLREAANASQLRRNFKGSPLLYVPDVYWDYCRRNVMVMERIYGARVTDIALLNEYDIDIKMLAERGVEIFFTQVFDHNFFHADMHPGNVYVALDNPTEPSYISLDMAIIGTLSRQDQFYMARNMLAMFRRDYRQVAELHVLSGWVPKDTSVAAFEAAIRTVCEPIFEKPIKDISFGDALVTLFQTARRFDMPVQPQLVLLQKTLLNIEGVGRQLYPELDLWETAHPFLERWLKKRFHPATLFKDLRREAPEWMEKLPQTPHLLLDTISHVNKLAEAAPDFQKTNQVFQVYLQERRRQNRRRIIAATAFACAGLLAWPLLDSLPLEVVLLMIVGLVALITA